MCRDVDESVYSSKGYALLYMLYPMLLNSQDDDVMCDIEPVAVQGCLCHQVAFVCMSHPFRRLFFFVFIEHISYLPFLILLINVYSFYDKNVFSNIIIMCFFMHTSNLRDLQAGYIILE